MLEIHVHRLGGPQDTSLSVSIQWMVHEPQMLAIETLVLDCPWNPLDIHEGEEQEGVES